MDQSAERRYHFLDVSETPLAISVTLNRMKVLNALNFKLITELDAVLRATGKRRYIMRGAGKVFSAGADIIPLSRHPEQCEPFFRLAYSIPNTTNSLKGWSVAFMKGITIGGGAGLSYSCKARVAMPSTVWAFPETSIGTVPDAAANYVLTRISSEAVGRFLSLTGERLNGVDCFYLGIATHYFPDNAFEEQAAKELLVCEDPETTMAKFHRTPDFSACRVLLDKAEIEEVFSNVASVEDVLERLKRRKTQWARKTLALIHYMCPLSLKVEFRYFDVARMMTYTQICMMDYDVVYQLTSVRNENYREGVQHRLVRKEKTRPKWSPASLDQVSNTEVSAILANADGPRLALL